MAILTGRNGTVKWDPVPASPQLPTALLSIDGWTLSLKTDYEEVSCFGDSNKVYIPGLRDLSGTIKGFWNSASPILVQASNQSTPGYLELAPNSTESSFVFGGLAYMDANVDCSLLAPKVSGTFKAAGPWITP
jgi:hypothetical protein